MKIRYEASVPVIIALLGAVLFVSYRCSEPRGYEFTDRSYSAPEEREAKNVYLILVDGLRFDSVLSDMPLLSDLIDHGGAFFAKARFDGPSYSKPGYARILTGTPAEINGIWSNQQRIRCAVPSIFEEAKKSGLATGASAYFWIGQLFNATVKTDKPYYNPDDNIQYGYFYGPNNINDSQVFRIAEETVKKHSPNLYLIHPMEVDRAGHRSGSCSDEYRRSVRKEDILITDFLKSIESDKSLVIITSDHGHTQKGGHGGNSPPEVEVPIVMIGGAVDGGIYRGVFSHQDIAPTVCAMLGIPPNRFMAGCIIDRPIKSGRRYLMGGYNRLSKY